MAVIIVNMACTNHKIWEKENSTKATKGHNAECHSAQWHSAEFCCTSCNWPLATAFSTIIGQPYHYVLQRHLHRHFALFVVKLNAKQKPHKVMSCCRLSFCRVTFSCMLWHQLSLVPAQSHHQLPNIVRHFALLIVRPNAQRKSYLRQSCRLSFCKRPFSCML